MGKQQTILLLVALVLIGLLGGCARAESSAPAVELSGVLAVEAPAQIAVGEPLLVHVVREGAPDGVLATLVAQGSYGAGVFRAAFAKGRAELVLPGEATRQSGYLTLTVTAGTARGAAGVEIRPGAPADPVTPLVGGRSIAADGKHWSMAVAVPFDSYGNPVADATPVEFRALHPGDKLETKAALTEHLVAWQRIYSGTRAGRTTVSVSAAGAHGPDASFFEIPNWPAAFALSASPAELPADGRQLITLRTDVIRDRYGNAMLDGTLVTFVVDTPEGEPRFIPAYTIDGAAEALLQAAEQPGVLQVRATLYGVESAPLAISFTPGPAVGEFPVAAQVNAREGGVALEAGPMLAPLGQFIPDGQVVTFELAGPDGATQRIDGEAKNGRARAELRLETLARGRYTVTVAVGAGHGTTTFVVP